MENTNEINNPICNILVCLNSALENGYCIDHQDFVGNELDYTNPTKKHNGVEMFLNIVGFSLIFIGLIARLVQANQSNEVGSSTFNFIVFFTYLFVRVSSGALFIGLAEIIKLFERSLEKREI
jgi:hypothetical protein